jgi:hypothetical protein
MGSQNLLMVLMSRKFSVAPLSMRAFSVSCVVVKTNSIVKAFRLVINMRHVTSAGAATTNEGTSKNPVH